MRNENLLYSREEREALRHTVIYNETNQVWNDNQYNRRANIGTISYLLRSAHNLFCSDSDKLMTFTQWEMYYLRSGEKRIELKSVELSKKDEKAIDMFYGRTFDDIMQIATEFKDSLDEKGFHISYRKVLNFCYIRIVDEAYIGYKREYNTISSLKETFPDYKFKFADDYIDVQLGVDIIVRKKGKIIGGFQVKSDIYRDSDRPHNLEAKEVNDKKFKRCKKERGFYPKYIYVDRQGKISEPFPDMNF